MVVKGRRKVEAICSEANSAQIAIARAITVMKSHGWAGRLGAEACDSVLDDLTMAEDSIREIRLAMGAR